MFDLFELIRLATELGVLGVVFGEIGNCYGLLRDDGVIVLNKSDIVPMQCVALCHEIGHWVNRHTLVPRCDRGYLPQEAEADEVAAVMLIDGLAYRTAEETVGADPTAIALELGIPLRIVRAWRRVRLAERMHAA